MGRFLKFENVTFAYDGMEKPLLCGVTLHFPEGCWTGVVGANGCGKTTLLRLATGALEPQRGAVSSLGRAIVVEQRTDFPPADYAEFLEAADGDAAFWRARLGVGPGLANRWDTLSHGERKRIQVGAALWRSPGVLALDEPTNHLDVQARDALLSALRAFRGVGLVVSHDRDFLDSLCTQCVFLFPPEATMRPGGVTAGEREDRREQEFARERDERARGEAKRLRDSAHRQFEAAQQLAARNKAARNAKIPANDHDGRAKRNLAKLTGKDAWAVTKSAALAKRASRAEAARAGLHPRKDYDTGFWLEGSEASRRNVVLAAPAGSITLGDGRTLAYPDLRIAPSDRIALTGPNGIGKTTLLRHILAFSNVPAEKLLVVPQEITAEESAGILAEAKALHDDALGRVMTSVSRLGSRPGRLLQSEVPSPGEVRKLLLALGVNRGIHLLVMDEPTNHLDLDGIECLEEALADCPCAMIVVSHDRRFLDRIGTREWRLSAASPTAVRLDCDA